MIQKFIDNFKPDRQSGMQVFSGCHLDENIMHCLAGLSFENGLYRFYTDAEGERWTDIVLSVFHQYKGRIFCFASDWLGRQFATDNARIIDGQPQILMFQVGSGEVFEVPSNIEKFHNDVLVNMPNPTLEKTMYKSWLEAGNVPPQRSQCVGYKIPLFLGGTDNVDNLNTIDMEVEWKITGQLLNVAAKIPRGSRIDSVRIDTDAT